MSGISAVMNVSPTGAPGLEDCSTEAQRIGFLLERDGLDAARTWVRRTLAIYRSAVLDPRHFASAPDYRRRYLLSCADFRRWLGRCK